MTPIDWLNQTFTREKNTHPNPFPLSFRLCFPFPKRIICLESPTKTPPSKDIDKCPEEIKNHCALSYQLSNLVTKDQCVSWQGVQKKTKRIPRKQSEFPRRELRHPSPWLQITPPLHCCVFSEQMYVIQYLRVQQFCCCFSSLFFFLAKVQEESNFW